MLILFIAIALDLALGEPPGYIHPVVWMGKAVSLMEKGGTSKSYSTQFLFGLMTVLFVAGLFTAPAYFILRYLDGLSTALYIIAGALLLKTTFSLKGLRRAAGEIRDLLREDKLEEARFGLRSLVSRDTRGLPEPLLVSAAVESVAENASDSFVAPLFYFLLLGIPGAIAYRVVNTMDAMIGYHGRYEYLGKFASRLDDVLNIIPARLTALLIIAAAFLSGRDGRGSWKTALGEHARTESPNAGWPMAAMAGALNVRLEKTGQYKLGNAGAPLVPETIDASLELAQIAVSAWVSICLVAGVIRLVITA